MGNLFSKSELEPDSQTSQGSPAPPAANQPLDSSPTPGASELQILLAEKCGTIKHLEAQITTLQAVQSRQHIIENWLLEKVVEKPVPILPPAHDDRKHASELAALHQRIVALETALEKELENSRKVPEASQPIQDLMGFDNDNAPIHTIDVLTPSWAPQIAPRAPASGGSANPAGAPPGAVNGAANPTPETPTSHVSIPPHCRYYDRLPGISRTRERGGSPYAHPINPLPTPPVAVPTGLRQHTVGNAGGHHANGTHHVGLAAHSTGFVAHNASGLTQSRHVPTPLPLTRPQPPANVRRDPAARFKGNYWVITPLVPGKIHDPSGLLYHPSADVPKASSKRGVLVLGIPRGLKLRDILAKVTTGQLVSARLADTLKACGYITVHLQFVEASAAAKLVRAPPLIVRGYRLTTALINSPTWPLEKKIAEGIEHEGWSRYLSISPIPESMGPEDLEHELKSLTGVWDTSPALQFWQEGGDLTVEFASVAEANVAREHFARILRGVEGCVVGFGRDLWDRESWVAEEEENEEVTHEEVEGDGEGTEGKEQTVGGAQEMLIDID